MATGSNILIGLVLVALLVYVGWDYYSKMIKAQAEAQAKALADAQAQAQALADAQAQAQALAEAEARARALSIVPIPPNFDNDVPMVSVVSVSNIGCFKDSNIERTLPNRSRDDQIPYTFNKCLKRAFDNKNNYFGLQANAETGLLDCYVGDSKVLSDLYGTSTNCTVYNGREYGGIGSNALYSITRNDTADDVILYSTIAQNKSSYEALVTKGLKEVMHMTSRYQFRSNTGIINSQYIPVYVKNWIELIKTMFYAELYSILYTSIYEDLKAKISGKVSSNYYLQYKENKINEVIFDAYNKFMGPDDATITNALTNEYNNFMNLPWLDKLKSRLVGCYNDDATNRALPILLGNVTNSFSDCANLVSNYNKSVSSDDDKIFYFGLQNQTNGTGGQCWGEVYKKSGINFGWKEANKTYDKYGSTDAQCSLGSNGDSVWYGRPLTNAVYAYSSESA